MGLVLAGHDGQRVELGDGARRRAVVGPAQVVLGCAVLDGRGPPGQDVGVALQDGVGVLALQAVHQRRVAVEVVEVLEQAEAVDLRQVRVGLVLGDAAVTSMATCSKPMRRLERRLVGRVEPVHQRLLVLLDAAHLRERALQVGGSCARRRG